MNRMLCAVLLPVLVQELVWHQGCDSRVGQIAGHIHLGRLVEAQGESRVLRLQEDGCPREDSLWLEREDAAQRLRGLAWHQLCSAQSLQGQ